MNIEQIELSTMVIPDNGFEWLVISSVDVGLGDVNQTPLKSEVDTKYFPLYPRPHYHAHLRARVEPEMKGDDNV